MHIRQSQQGASLIVFILAIIATGAVFVISTLGPENERVSSENDTSASLAKAKTALLSYAASYYLTQSTGATPIPHAGRHGLLPCPEQPSGFNGEGNSSNQCGVTHTNSLGRLPWKHMGIEPLKDSSGECLWYAVSGGFYNTPRSEMTNDDTPGMFQIINENGNVIQGLTAEDRVVAVVLAPGLPVNGQTRSSATLNSPCKVPGNPIDASDYLEFYQDIDNASVSNANPDLIDQFINSTGLNNNPIFNDRLISITAGEIFDAIKQQQSMYDTKITMLGTELANCLVNYSIASDDIVNPPDACATDCSAARSLCRLSATTGPEKAACNKTYVGCRKSCGGSTGKGKGKGGSGGGGGGSSSTAYQLPWPAAINLNADYRLNNSYQDLTASQASNSNLGLLGRLPFRINNSNNATGISTTNNTLLEACGISIPGETGLLWQNWKDHWFYVVGRDHIPGSTQSSSCTNCPVFNGNKYAAILIFSGERIPGQLRRTNDTENPDPLINNSKSVITNYLEGSNASNYIDGDGNKNYAIYNPGDNENDQLFCIKTDMSEVTGECP